MRCTENTPVYSIHTIQELVMRLLNELDLLAPLGGYYTELKVEADNATEPAIISVHIYEGQKRSYPTPFECFVDQNTTYWEFCSIIHNLHNAVVTANKAFEDKIDYFEAVKRLEEERKERYKDLPF